MRIATIGAPALLAVLVLAAAPGRPDEAPEAAPLPQPAERAEQPGGPESAPAAAAPADAGEAPAAGTEAPDAASEAPAAAAGAPGAASGESAAPETAETPPPSPSETSAEGETEPPAAVAAPAPEGAPEEAEGVAAEEPAAAAPPSPDGPQDNELDEVEGPIGPPEEGPSDAGRAACEAVLDSLHVTYRAADPLQGEKPCGAPAPISVSAVGPIELRPAMAMRCPVAQALALWIDRVAAPLADLYLDQSLRAVLLGTGYQCRRRRGDGTAKYSEHAFANAIDVMGVVLHDGAPVPIEPREGSSDPERAFQAGIRGGACAFFTTVLGPMTNGAHADHLHLDMAQRRGGYRLCE